MPAVVLQNPAQPIKLSHTRPEDDLSQPKKPRCTRPDDEIAIPGCKADEPKESYGEGAAILTYCRFCDKKGTHITANCPWEPDDESDSDDDPDVVEYGGEREGYSWTCLLGCGSYPCTLDHYYNKGIYVQKACRLCYKVGHHWSYECSIKPTYTYDLPTSQESAVQTDKSTEVLDQMKQ